MNKDLIKFESLTKSLASTIMDARNRDQDFMPFLERYFKEILELRFSMGELIDIPHEHLVYRNVTFIILLGQILKKLKPNQAGFDKTRDAMVAAYQDTLANIQSYYFKDIYKDGEFIEPKLQGIKELKRMSEKPQKRKIDEPNTKVRNRKKVK